MIFLSLLFLFLFTNSFEAISASSGIWREESSGYSSTPLKRSPLKPENFHVSSSPKFEELLIAAQKQAYKPRLPKRRASSVDYPSADSSGYTSGAEDDSVPKAKRTSPIPIPNSNGATTNRSRMTPFMGTLSLNTKDGNETDDSSADHVPDEAVRMGSPLPSLVGDDSASEGGSLPSDSSISLLNIPGGPATSVSPDDELLETTDHSAPLLSPELLEGAVGNPFLRSDPLSRQISVDTVVAPDEEFHYDVFEEVTISANASPAHSIVYTPAQWATHLANLKAFEAYAYAHPELFGPEGRGHMMF